MSVTIETPSDWWKAVEDHWEDLLSAVRTFHPASTQEEQLKGEMPSDLDLRITAAAPEMAQRMIRETVAKKEKELAAPADRLIEAREKKDWESAYRIFSNTWFGIPDSTGAWGVPSFGVLCDLCSEAWVFEEEEQDAERS